MDISEKDPWRREKQRVRLRKEEVARAADKLEMEELMLRNECVPNGNQEEECQR